MKTTVLLLFLAACPNPKVVNKTSYPINKRDKEIIAQCQKRCGEIYPDAPCLKYFEKYGEHDYNCLCGN